MQKMPSLAFETSFNMDYVHNLRKNPSIINQVIKKCKYRKIRPQPQLWDDILKKFMEKMQL